MYKQTLLRKLANRKATAGVIGLGYVGLPLAVELARAGFKVVGIERNPSRVEAVNRGESYVPDVLNLDLEGAVSTGNLKATQSFDVLHEADVIVICVPTPLDKNKQPDTVYIEYVVEQSLPHLHPGQLMILESTTYPGTTEEVIKPRLEGRGFELGKSYFLAFSPERIDPGNRTFSVKNTPKVVGGVTPACTEVAAAFYSSFLEGGVFTVSSPRAAEMAKLLENVFRIVNISLVNELALLCEKMGIDIWGVIEAAKTKPFGFMAFYPGPGLGGHCIPLDPFYLAWKAKEYDFTTRFIELAGQVNDVMPYHVVKRAMELLNDRGKPLKDAKVLLLGMAYKKDVDDLRESPALKIAELLTARGAVVSYHDPYIPELASQDLVLRSVQLTPETLAGQDLVIITTDHSNVDYELVVKHAPLIFDTRNATRGIKSSKVVRLGVG